MVTRIAVSTPQGRLINEQLPDGTWPLDWSWEKKDPVNWKIAEREWKAHLAIRLLSSLEAYARVADNPWKP